VLERLGAVMPFWDKSLDLIILTHPDADHITGLVNVLKAYSVKQVLWTGVQKDTRVFKAWQEALAREKAKETIARTGQRVRWSGNERKSLEILYAPEDPAQEVPVNETSIISKLVYGEHSVLLPGDTTVKIERQLVEQGADLKADILKVAHHGSKTSSSKEFLEAVAPETAVIFVGKDNRFGHPTPEVLAKLAEYGIDTKRTDKGGTISFYFK
jgi:competence protein ComEC